MGWTVHVQVHKSITDAELILSATASATEASAQSPRDVKQTFNKRSEQRSVGGVSLKDHSAGKHKLCRLTPCVFMVG